MDSTEFLAATRGYCLEELKQGWVFLGLGLVFGLVGVWLWRSQSAFRHALWPLVLLAVVQVAVGSATLLRMPTRIHQAESRMAADASAFKASETLRVTRVLDSFRFYKLAEIAGVLIAIGLALFLPHNPVARGWALGLLLQAAVLLAADLVAEQRTEAYLDLLRRL